MDFSEFISNQGVNFENNIIKFIINKYPDWVKKIANYREGFSMTKYEETQVAMKKGVPIIYQAVLQDKQNKIFGIPDILIRSDYINKFIPNSIPLEYENIKSPLLGNNVNYHYYVIDIKFSTLQLDKDGEFLLNSNELPAYKSQVCIYNIALGRMQGLTPNYGFILGRRIKFNI